MVLTKLNFSKLFKQEIHLDQLKSTSTAISNSKKLIFPVQARTRDIKKISSLWEKIRLKTAKLNGYVPHSASH